MDCLWYDSSQRLDHIGSSISKAMSSTSRKVSKKVALERLRDARRKRDTGELDAERDVLEGNNFRVEEDVYDVVDEEEYRSLVEWRRQREDFFVDDGEYSV